MAEVFADTSGWVNGFVRTEAFHAQAAALLRQWQRDGTRVVTTNYILAELIALYVNRVRSPRVQQIQTIETVKTAAWVEIVHVDTILDEAGWTLFKTRPDKDWTLTDCISFVVMQQRGITEAFAEDHHFEQAGFVRLLK